MPPRRALAQELQGVLAQACSPARLARFEVLCGSVAELAWAREERELTLESHGRVHAVGCANPHIALVTGTAPAISLLASKRAKRAGRLIARCGCWQDAPGALAQWEDAVSWLHGHEREISTWLEWRGKLEQVQGGRLHPMSLASSVARRSSSPGALAGVWQEDLQEARRVVRQSWRSAQQHGALGFDEEILWREVGSDRGSLMAEALVLADEEPVQLLVPSSSWVSTRAFAELLGDETCAGPAGWVGQVAGQLAAAIGGFVLEEELEEVQARLVLELLESERTVRRGHVERACDTAREVMHTL